MTVAELIEALSTLPQDLPVRWAAAPDWPMEYEIASTSPRQVGATVYLAEGDQLGYLPGRAMQVWREAD